MPLNAQNTIYFERAESSLIRAMEVVNQNYLYKTVINLGVLVGVSAMTFWNTYNLNKDTNETDYTHFAIVSSGYTVGVSALAYNFYNNTIDAYNKLNSLHSSRKVLEMNKMLQIMFAKHEDNPQQPFDDEDIQAMNNYLACGKYINNFMNEPLVPQYGKVELHNVCHKADSYIQQYNMNMLGNNVSSISDIDQVE